MLPVVVNGRLVFVPVDADTVTSSGVSALLDGLATTAAATDLAPAAGERVLNRGVTTAALSEFGLDEVQYVAAALDDAHRYLDGSVVDYFRRRLEACKADDGNLGPRKALPVVLGILGAIEQHGREVKPEVRRQLLSLGAEGAEFAGWLYRDIHDLAAAGYWYDRATEWAQEAGDTGMQGYVLLKKSQMAYDERDALRVWTLAEAEQSGLLGAYFTEGTLRIRSASCYAEGGQPARAAALFDDVITSGALSRRDEGFFRARRARVPAFRFAGAPLRRRWLAGQSLGCRPTPASGSSPMPHGSGTPTTRPRPHSVAVSSTPTSIPTTCSRIVTGGGYPSTGTAPATAP